MSRTQWIQTKKLEIYATVVSDDCIRITYTPAGVKPQKPTIGVVLQSAAHDLKMGKSHKLSKSAENLKVSFENTPWSMTWDQVTGQLWVFKEDQLVSLDQPLQTGEPQLRYHRLGAVGLYGLGEKYNWMNRIESKTENWNTDVIGISPLHHGLLNTYHTSIPFHVSLHQDFVLGRFFDNSYRTAFDLDAQKENFFSFSADGGQIDSYIMCADSVKEVVRTYGKITGTMPMPRLDYLGYQQCRWSYMDQDEVVQVARQMRQHDIPLDVIYLDIDYMEDFKVFTTDPKRFSNVSTMTQTLGNMGVKTVAIVDPGVKVEKGYSVYDEALEQGYLVTTPEGKPYVGKVWPGDSAFPDFMRREVRDWWGAQHDFLLNQGIDGIWNDMNEPADMSTEDKTIPKDCIHLDDEGAAHTHQEIHNLYGNYEAMSTYKALKVKTNKRPFVLTRAAYAGAQRHAALWMGDNSSLWEHLESSIPMMVNMGISGYSFIGADIGGFLDNSNGELLVRWTQLGAFMPLFRNHSSKDTLMQEPWQFGDAVLNDVRAAIKTRYQLITYLYQCMRESHVHGDPVIRPLFYVSKDPETFNIQDQFFFGDALMICPVYRPGQKRRMVYLPEGKWHHFYSGQVYEGKQWLIVEAPITEIPVFVKEGTILPLDPARSFIQGPSKTLEISIYGGDSGEVSLYFDDGMSFEFENGICSEMTIGYRVVEEQVQVSVYSEGPYPVPEIKIVLKGSLAGKMVSIES